MGCSAPQVINHGVLKHRSTPIVGAHESYIHLEIKQS